MSKIVRPSNYLLLVSIVACIISAFVFVFLLTQSTVKYTIALEEPYNSDQVIILINKERVKNNLKPLMVEKLLTNAANNKNRDMIKNNYFSHISPVDGKKWSDFIKEAKYEYVEAGENLANGFQKADEMVNAWMNSPTHRANILGEGYTETGVAVQKGKINGADTIFVTQVFGRR